MTNIIAIANQKGGVGKSTTAINIASCIAKKGHKTLLIDLDPQGNASSGFGIEKNKLKKTIYDIIINDEPVENVIKLNILDNIDIIPSNTDLSAAEVELTEIEDRVNVLKTKLNGIKDNYEYIIVDCPPALGMLTINACTFATSILIPVQCEYYALEGLNQLLETIVLVKESLNENLKIEGIVFTMYDVRNKLSQDVVDNVKNNVDKDIYIYKTIIPRNVRLAEAPSYGQPINMYDPTSTGAKQYEKLSDEIILRR